MLTYLLTWQLIALVTPPCISSVHRSPTSRHSLTGGLGGSYSSKGKKTKSPAIVEAVIVSGKNGRQLLLDPFDRKLKDLRTLKQHYYPEGGWGWVIVLVTTTVHLLMTGLQYGLALYASAAVATTSPLFVRRMFATSISSQPTSTIIHFSTIDLMMPVNIGEFNTNNILASLIWWPEEENSIKKFTELCQNQSKDGRSVEYLLTRYRFIYLPTTAIYQNHTSNCYQLTFDIPPEEKCITKR